MVASTSPKQLIDDSVIEAIETTAALAPLRPTNLAGIAATRKVFPDLPQVAVFDTAFRQTLRAYRCTGRCIPSTAFAATVSTVPATPLLASALAS